MSTVIIIPTGEIAYGIFARVGSVSVSLFNTRINQGVYVPVTNPVDRGRIPLVALRLCEWPVSPTNPPAGSRAARFQQHVFVSIFAYSWAAQTYIQSIIWPHRTRMWEALFQTWRLRVDRPLDPSTTAHRKHSPPQCLCLFRLRLRWNG